MVVGVEMPVETAGHHRTAGFDPVRVQMLGPLTLCRHDTALALPTSRKVRALFAYLALTPQAVTRTQLCELLWDVPNDPRGELRWCLSKIRGLIGPARVEARADAVGLDLADCLVDATEIIQGAQGGAQRIDALGAEQLRGLVALFNGDFLEGLDIDRSPVFSSWVTAQRRQFRSYHAALLARLVRIVPDNEVLGYLEQWLALAPFDHQVHALLLQGLARRGQIREGEEHLAATMRRFEAEELDGSPIREAWRVARAQGDQAPFARATCTAVATTAQQDPEAGPARRASIAVMPFIDRSVIAGPRGGIADALAYDVIARIARLRSLFVIAQGSVFALHEQRCGPEEAGRMLKVDYVVNGFVRHHGTRLTVMVELTEMRTARVVWAEHFNHRVADAFIILDEIGNRIVACIASEIETVERNRAVLRPPNSLDAWEAYHRGLWHMYRFNKVDNAQARHFFAMAIRLDPTFARAYAGLSFTHFQNAFNAWEHRAPEIDRAFDAAGQGLMVDDRDPAAHWAMGRALWLRGRHDQSVAELDQVIDLSPNFALGHYTLSFVNAQAGDPRAAILSADRSRGLSPYDPMLFAMFGSRAMALMRIGRFEDAADWGTKAAARPNAHTHVHAIAAFSLALADRLDEAQAQAAAIRRALPNYGVDDFVTAMRLAPEAEQLFRHAARRIGMGSP